jgi:hypothetical protein
LIIAGALFQEMNLPDNSIRITREPGARLKRRWFFPSGLDGTAHISFFATVCTPL